MPTSKWLELALAFHEKLNDALPALVREVNSIPIGADIPIVMPVEDSDGYSISLDVDPGLIDGKEEDFPRAQCGVFARTVEEEFSSDIEQLGYPYTVEIYIAAPTKRKAFVQGAKWGTVLDMFFERYSEDIHPSFRTRPSTDTDMTFSLPKGKGQRIYYTKLVSAVGEFQAYE